MLCPGRSSGQGEHSGKFRHLRTPIGRSAWGGCETSLPRTISRLPRETALAESKRGKKDGGDYLYLLKI